MSSGRSSPEVRFISALCGGNGEKVLRGIAASSPTAKILRQFDAWELGADGLERCSGTASDPDKNKTIIIVLVLGKQEGFFLKDRPHFSSFRPVGDNAVDVGSEMPEVRLVSLANQVIAWVMRGKSWHDQSGEIRTHFYGPAPNVATRARRNKKRKAARVARQAMFSFSWPAFV